MEELQDAIEDAQYVNAIATQEDGPRPVLPWNTPTEEELKEWEEKQKKIAITTKKCEAFGLDWTLSTPIGYFLFSSFCKEKCDDYVRMNFCEDVLRYKMARGRARREKAQAILRNYIDTPKKNPETGEAIRPDRTEIHEYDLERAVPGENLRGVQLASLYKLNMDDPITYGESSIGLKKGPILKEIAEQTKIEGSLQKSGSAPAALLASSKDREDGKAHRSNSVLKALPESKEIHDGDLRKEKVEIRGERRTKELPGNIFDEAEAVVIESLRRNYWDQFLESVEYKKVKNFSWYQDRPVLSEDFFVMRVLGRGGFGLVTGMYNMQNPLQSGRRKGIDIMLLSDLKLSRQIPSCLRFLLIYVGQTGCKKGTSGKLYAMKTMSKRRIKMKKSEQLAINERQALAAVESPFVVNLKYSFHSKDDVFLILDLMTGGDLGYHLHQKGRFPKKECLYYSARIMLGLQALHDKQYVYRDLKPENCLLAEDGRVRITDLGLATRITPTLHGAAGTRGYWAPEMLRRDKKGRRMVYGHSVDWFSFGCCVAEFISGTNPFRSETSLNFGLERGKQTKEKAIDCATLEMDPEFNPERFDPDAADLCRRLLDKNEETRLGHGGCEEIMAHPWFKNVNWDSIITDRKTPPYVPPKDVNAASQSEIGNFVEDKAYQETTISEADEEVYKDWDWINPRAFSSEVLEFLIYERESGEPLVPITHNASCCCVIL